MAFHEHVLQRQIEFSSRTFGTGARTEGVLDHIGKELIEVMDSPTHDERVKEWVDLVILAQDGLLREIKYGQGDPPLDDEMVAIKAVIALDAKQTVNEGRKWPDWRTADPNKAIEHVKD